MKKLFTICLITIVILVGCGGNVYEEPQSEDKRFSGLKSDAVIVTDSETGCKYIYIDRGMLDKRVMALSPLMKSDGTADCGQ